MLLRNRRWLPGFVGLAVLILTLWIWGSLLAQQSAEAQRELTDTATSTAQVLKTEMNGITLGLNRAAQRWQVRGGIPKTEWQADASNYIRNTPGLQRIDSFDAKLQPRWLPYAQTASTPDPDLLQFLKTQRTTLKRNRFDAPPNSTGDVYPPLARSLTLHTQGQTRFQVVIPLWLPPVIPMAAPRLDGFLVSTFSTRAFFEKAIANVPLTYNLAVMDGAQIYQRYPIEPSPTAANPAATSTVNSILDDHWRVSVWLDPRHSSNLQSRLLANVVLGAGLGMAALLALVTYLAQAMGDRARQLETTNQQIAAKAESRQQLALALQESEAQYRDLFENSNDLIVSVDMAGQFIYTNRAWKETLGYDESDLISLTLFDLAFPDCGGRCDDLRQCLTVGEATEHLEVAFTSKSQQQVWLEGSLNFRYVDQKPVSIRCIFRNISDRRQADKERKRIEEQLRRSEERWQLAIKAKNDGIWDLDLKTGTAYRSTRWSQSMGYAEGELLDSNMEWQTRIHPDDCDRVLQTEQDYLDRRIPQLDQIYRLRHRDGSYLWVQSRAQAVWDEAGTPVRLVGSTTNITEQIQAEVARKRSEEEIRHLSHALEIAVVGISQLDAGGRYLMVKPAYAKMLGYLPEEMMGMHWRDTVHPEDWEKAIAAHQQMLTADKAEIEIRAIRKNQSVFEQKIVLVKAYDDAHQFSGHYGFMKDISDRREVERLKEEFVSTVSHELRTPLTSISVALDLLASGVLQTQPEEAQRMLNIAANNTDRLVRLINDILDIERVRSGKVAMNKQTCSVADLFAQSVQTVQDMADKAEITLAVSSLDTHLWIDPDRIVQVLVNLLSNAIKFSPLGGTVRLNAEITAPSFLTVSVQDQGRGIPAENLDSIFDPFQQVDASDSRQKGGTGLGLAICRSIVQQHGGKLGVESRVAEGSRFWVQLPALRDVERQITEPSQSDAAPLVLTCDDDASVQSVIQTLLEQQGYRVLATGSGKEAVEQASITNPQVVLLNLTMPEMDGWETLAALKRQPETQAIPVVILSGLMPDATHLDRLDITGWVVKPPNQKVLLETLERALNKPHQNIRVLIVEDDPDLAKLLIMICTRNQLEAFHAQTGQEAIRLSQEIMPDLLVLDLGIPEGDGFAVVDWLRHHNHLSRLPLVVYTARDLEPADRDRLTLADNQTLFLTKGRITTQQFEQRLIALLNRITRLLGSGESVL